jgi:purine nucleosidase
LLAPASNNSFHVVDEEIASRKGASMVNETRRRILDTDIGSDVDDILALVALANMDGGHLIGVSTVHGDTALRARIAQYVCNSLGLSEVAVTAGETGTVGGRPIGRGWKGHEGQGIPELDSIRYTVDIDGVDLLCALVRTHPGEVDIFAIGPLTNIARAIERDPDFAQNIGHLYIMGGAFWKDRAEHNIVCDPEAAAAVFDTRIPMTVCGLDVTTKVLLREDGVLQISRSLGELGAILERQIRQWWAYKESIGDFMDDSGKATAN